MDMERAALQHAAENNKIFQIIVNYLKQQQAIKDDFFSLFLQKKINGRLFYNTCLPDGTKETKFGNEDFTHAEFKQAIDVLLTPFQHLTLAEVTAESVQTTDITTKMQNVIAEFMQCLESSNEWKIFWESEINLPINDKQRQELYNLIAGAAAYKAFVSCIDQSAQIKDPIIKRNIAALINICTDKYESSNLITKQNSADNRSEFAIKPKANDASGDFAVLKKQKAAADPTHQKVDATAKRKSRRKKPAQQNHAVMK